MILGKNWSTIRKLMVQGAIGGIKTVEDFATGNPVVFFTDLAKPLKSLMVNFLPVQEGTGDPSTDNVRPIAGWSGASVYRTGVNVWDEETELGGINSSTGQEYPATGAIRAKNYIPVVPGASYYLKAPSMTGFTDCWYDKDKNRISTTYQVNGVKTAPNNAYFFRFGLPSSYGTTYNHDISINYPSTETEYAPYTGESFPVDWTDEAGTVYGGVLDLVTGVLTVEWAGYSAKWEDGTDASDRGTVTRKKFPLPFQSVTASAKQTGYCNVAPWKWDFERDSIHFYVHQGYAYVFLPNDTDEETDIQMIAQLATPITVGGLDPVTINALKGVNTIWSDANGDIEVTYLKKG